MKPEHYILQQLFKSSSKDAEEMATLAKLEDIRRQEMMLEQEVSVTMINVFMQGVLIICGH